jgi:hypothetical protein
LICKKDRGSATLLAFLLGWHQHKIKAAAQAALINEHARLKGEPATQSESLWQWHREKDLKDSLLGYSQNTIRRALGHLENLGFISVQENKGNLYFRRLILVHPEAVQDAIDQICAPESRVTNDPTGVKSDSSGVRSDSSRVKNDSTEVRSDSHTLISTDRPRILQTTSTGERGAEAATQPAEVLKAAGGIDVVEGIEKEKQKQRRGSAGEGARTISRLSEELAAITPSDRDLRCASDWPQRLHASRLLVAQLFARFPERPHTLRTLLHSVAAARERRAVPNPEGYLLGAVTRCGGLWDPAARDEPTAPGGRIYRRPSTPESRRLAGADA